jgi:hypothetical protein
MPRSSTTLVASWTKGLVQPSKLQVGSQQVLSLFPDTGSTGDTKQNSIMTAFVWVGDEMMFFTARKEGSYE